jgi:hypothetical protein
VDLLDFLFPKGLEGGEAVGERTHWAGRPS